jgi:hypothetical protein
MLEPARRFLFRQFCQLLEQICELVSISLYKRLLSSWQFRLVYFSFIIGFELSKGGQWWRSIMLAGYSRKSLPLLHTGCYSRISEETQYGTRG